jgi:Bacterial capsule synthesis protein PGA_cap
MLVINERTFVIVHERTFVSSTNFKCLPSTTQSDSIRIVKVVTGPRRSLLFVGSFLTSFLMIAFIATSPTHTETYAMQTSVLAQSYLASNPTTATSETTTSTTTATPTTTPTPTTPTPSTPPTPWTLTFGGDTLYTRSLNRLRPERTPFARVSPALESSDFAIVNLETALTTRGRAQSKTFTFRSPPGFAAVIREAGIDAVSLANNHTLDFGVTGFEDTLDALDATGVARIGGGRTRTEALEPHIIERGGVRVALLGATQIVPGPSWVADDNRPGLATVGKEISDSPTQRLLQAVRTSRTRADLVVVVLHWGIEGDSCPSRIQRKLARELHGAGAAIVLGAHPHVLQPIEQDGLNLTAFSLGNFIWDPRSGATADTGTLEIQLIGSKLSGYTFYPHRLDGNGWANAIDPLSKSAERVVLRTTRTCA